MPRQQMEMIMDFARVDYDHYPYPPPDNRTNGTGGHRARFLTRFGNVPFYNDAVHKMYTGVEPAHVRSNTICLSSLHFFTGVTMYHVTILKVNGHELCHSL
jgi:hypothetical protein